MTDLKTVVFKKTTIWSLFMDKAKLPQGCRATLRRQFMKIS